MSLADRRRNARARAAIARVAGAAGRGIARGARTLKRKLPDVRNSMRKRFKRAIGRAPRAPRFAIGRGLHFNRATKKAVLPKGIVLTRELFGTIDTRNCAYIGFQTGS